jgi:hypothetical protein
MLGCVPSPTPLEQILIPTVAGLVGVLIGMVWAWLLQRQKDLSDERQRRDAAIAELLTATVDLITGIQIVRAAYEGQSGWPIRIRKAAVVIAALGSLFPGEPGSAAAPRSQGMVPGAGLAGSRALL